MYSKLEIIKIFSSVNNWDELKKICDLFMWLIKQEKVTKNRIFIAEMANFTFKRMENI